MQDIAQSVERRVVASKVESSELSVLPILLVHGALAELVDGTCLENKRTERFREFKSLTLRHTKN